jgi:hypothetical protein
VSVQICLRNPESPEYDDTVARIGDALALYDRLRESRNVEIRLHAVTLNNSLYRADGELLVVQHTYGLPTGRAPVLHLRRTNNGDMITTYHESFHRIWTAALPFA